MAELAIAAAISLVNTVVSSLIEENPIGVKNDLESIKTWLKTMQDYLKDTRGRESTEGSKNRVQQVRDVAYEIEDIVEEFMLDVPQHFHDHRVTKFLHNVAHSVTEWKAVNKLSSRMEPIKAKIKDIKKLDAFRVSPPSGSGGGEVHLESYYYPNVKDDELVGIEKHRDKLLDIITDEESRHMVISVVGPRGSGKTTLIKKVYETVKGSFDCHVWILVPRPHTGNGLLEKVCAAIELPPVRQGTDTRRILQSYLQQKRYIIVLDGIWSKEEWICISNVLPDGCHGSRIIISTHKHNIASSRSNLYNHIYFLNALTWEEGWELLCKKAFQHPKCPQHLVKWSQNILKRCEGLPLAIVSVGNLLSKKSQTPSEFQKLHDSLGYELESSDDLSVMRKILLQSYHYLSDILKCCFLYFCNFSEGCSVTRGRLVRLWIAEGFVEEKGIKTKEEVASDYLNELIYMSLVDVDKRDPEGRVRSCRVHSLVREVIISISEKENFSSVFTRPSTSSGEKPRRLSLQNCCINSLESKNFSCVRTLFMFGRDSCDESMARKLLSSFKLLRVLDFEDAALVTFPEEIVSLTLLRYLSFRNTHIKTIPRSIKKLQNLLTLDLRQTRVTKLPKKIFKLRKLLYLLVDRKDVYQDRAGAEVPSGIRSLTSLQKLSLIKANKNKGIIKELENLTELRKLGITELKEENGKYLCASIEKLKQLSSLYVTSTGEEEFLDLDAVKKPPRLIRSLYLGGRLQRIPQWICSLQSVVKVGLKWSKLERSPLEVLKALPSLIELHLADAYTREELEFKDGWFKELRILEIEEFSCLQVVVVSEGTMPKLQKLVFKRCGSLNRVHSGIHGLSQLKELLLYGMPEQLILPDFIKQLAKIVQ